MNRFKNMIVGCGLAAAAVGMASVATSRNAIGATTAASSSSASRAFVENSIRAAATNLLSRSDVVPSSTNVGYAVNSENAIRAESASQTKNSTSSLSADGVLTKLLSGDAAKWKTEDGTMTFVEDVASREETEDTFSATFCWPSVDDATRVLTYGWTWAGNFGMKVVEGFFCQYDTEDGSYYFPDSYHPNKGDGKTSWTKYTEGGHFAVGELKGITFTPAMSEEGLPAVTLVREGWMEVADLGNAFMSSPVEGDGSRFGWEFGALSVPRQLVFRIGKDGKRSAFAVRSNSGNVEMKFQTGTSDSQGGNLTVGNVNASRDDGTIGKCNIRATGDVVANAHYPVPVSLLSLNSDYASFKENFSSSVSTAVTNNSPVKDVQVSSDGSTYTTCVDGKIAKVNLSAYMKKTETAEDATSAHALSFLGSDWYDPTSAFIGMFRRDTGGSYTPVTTIEGADTATSFGVFCPGKGMSQLDPDGSYFLTEKRCDAKYQPILSSTSSVEVAGLSSTRITVNDRIEVKNRIELYNATNTSTVASRIYGTGNGKIVFGSTEISDAGSTLQVDGSDILTQNLADTLYATKGFRVSDYNQETIRDGMLYSRRPTAAETVSLKIYSGDFSSYVGSAKMFLDCSTAASSLSLSVSDSSSLSVLYRDGCVRLDEFASPNAYVIEFKWFNTSASGTEVKYAVVNAYKVGQ